MCKDCTTVGNYYTSPKVNHFLLDKREGSCLKWLFCDWEIHLSHWNKVCLNPLWQDKDVLCSVLATRALLPLFWGFDYILWVLIVTDLAYQWFHFIWAKKGPRLLAEQGIFADHHGCLVTSTFMGRWGTRLKFILTLGGMVLSLPPPVHRGQLLPSPLALQILCETT